MLSITIQLLITGLGGIALWIFFKEKDQIMYNQKLQYHGYVGSVLSSRNVRGSSASMVRMEKEERPTDAEIVAYKVLSAVEGDGPWHEAIKKVIGEARKGINSRSLAKLRQLITELNSQADDSEETTILTIGKEGLRAIRACRDYVPSNRI